jgi:hypothetical protein
MSVKCQSHLNMNSKMACLCALTITKHFIIYIANGFKDVAYNRLN